VELLKGAGFEVESPFAGIPTAFRARKGKGTAKVSLFVEYDALPAMTPAMMFDGKLAKVVNEKHGKPTQV
jgi:metal-dependent amidase/aminoacylase/carboxypeptidase family protein